jgi:hypothetical protein
MGDTRFALDRVSLRKLLKDALHQLNSATLHLREVQEDYRSRAIPFPDGDLAFRQALRAETEARREYMSVAMTLHDLVLHGKIPAPKVLPK